MIYLPPNDPRKFHLGVTVATQGIIDLIARNRVTSKYLGEILTRHCSGDYGVICDDDKTANTEALLTGSRILSAYPIDPAQPCAGFGENTIWIITDAADGDGRRQSTTVLLPDEY